ncbi:ABC transporter ATP-binding protein [Flammeovirga agarivorans]|uniref:ABC transporter ATP-binding protein n=1 Tax=Flammeovirga agarivorans TaxID=2726742 RepID=A0A7X8XWB9_9BACT|nr:ABC transporter ATP-binding protein [Flammeovirga agarivorans]NLR92059.1 ABC transporter ATP-binding protein [Flammeovirga agarivorans]
MEAEKIIETKDLTKKFGDFAAVNKISFDVKKGEIFGFLGANGAGKSTAMKMLTGLLTPTSGDAQVAGLNLYTQQEEIKKVIGYMSQKFSLYDDLSLQENIRFFGGIYGLPPKVLQERGDQMIDRLKLTDVKNKLLREVPLGWKQKIAFSVATLHQPKIVFLDEPTGGVDPITRRQFWEMIYEASDNGTTVFVTTHYMDEAEYCDRISIMVQGRIEGYGSTKELKSEFKSQNMDEVFIKLARGENYKLKS